MSHRPGIPVQAHALHLADVALERRWSRLRGAIYAPPDVVWAGVLAILWSSGYPAWRLGVLGALLLVAVCVQLLEVRRSQRGAAEATKARGMTDQAVFACTVAALAVTGALASPLVVFLPASVPLQMVLHGWTGRTRRRVAFINLAALALALAPASVVGPRLADGPYALALFLTLTTSAMTVAHSMGALLGAAHLSLRDALRAREELTGHALARARDLEQVGATLSHELKNPLGAIKALVQLSRRSPAGADLGPRLQVVEEEVDRMQGILQDYLSFTRPLERLQRQKVELAGLADEVLAALEARALEAGVALKRTGTPAQVDADARRVKEALLNLVANALEASAPGAQVEVQVSPAQDEQPACLRVLDQGRGMPPEVLARVGTPFFTTREEGTGLGVALARATFVQHGGTLEFRSVPGEGTVATATLPTGPREERR